MKVQYPVDSVRALVRDIILLLQQEAALARAETAEKINNFRFGVLYLILGLMLGFCAIFLLSQALIVLLGAYLGPWAPVVVALLFLAATAYFLWRGATLMKPENLMPYRTASSLGQTARTIREKV